MEVHHHPNVEKKNFKEYFLEFLMIFLAVTMGFFAESFRENITEKKMMHGYMAQMVENMKYDTTRCNNALTFNKKTSLYLDSLRCEIDNAANGNMHTNQLYYLYIKTLEFSTVLFKQSAITQLKNSGNLRLIENKALVNKLLEYYDRWVIAAATSGDFLDHQMEEFDKNSLNFFNWQYLPKLVKTDTVFSYARDSSIDNYIDAIRERNPPLALLNKKPEDLKKLNNQVNNVERSVHTFNSFLRLDKNLADTLIRQIEKEYDLNSEQE
jgi:hypothetical protein